MGLLNNLVYGFFTEAAWIIIGGAAAFVGGVFHNVIYAVVMLAPAGASISGLCASYSLLNGYTINDRVPFMVGVNVIIAGASFAYSQAFVPKLGKMKYGG
mmetsp:Transcript_3864/g.5255  ORF Transcript_3864/g.5255 Transcript_3864/m.5255 type:complete len:100 (+) Transcript_3864:88-387(+)